MQPKVIVLLAAFNGSSWIAEQVDSILNQTGVDLSLIISDDGSTDTTLTELLRFEHDPRVRVITRTSPTGSAAQNFLWLIRNTPADEYAYVALADQDDIWDREKLARGCSALTRQGAAGYSCAVTAFWNYGKETTLRQANVLTRSDFLFEGAGQGCTFVLAASFYRRLRMFLLQEATHTQSLHFHDWAIYALSRSWGLLWTFDPAPMLRYRQHTHNDTGARASIAGLIKRLRLIQRGWYSQQLLTIVEMCKIAAPANLIIAEWSQLLGQPRGLKRTFRIVRFCFKGGRRRILDNTMLLGAAIAGWI